MDEESFVKQYVTQLMLQYDAKKDEKMQKIKEWIARGYEASTRDGLLHVGCSNNMQHDRLLARVEVVHGVIYKSKKVQHEDATMVEVVCKRINMSVVLGQPDLEQVAVTGLEASTTTFGIFSCWLEYLLPYATSSQMWLVDPFWINLHRKNKLGQMMSHAPASVKLLYLPVLHDGHWSLYVVVNFSGHDFVRLQGREGILFMDPLNGVPDETINKALKDVVDRLWGEWDRADALLASPITPMKIPKQPNLTDCGYYIMKCILLLSDSMLLGSGSACKAGLKWFILTQVVLFCIFLQCV